MDDFVLTLRIWVLSSAHFLHLGIELLHSTLKFLNEEIDLFNVCVVPHIVIWLEGLIQLCKLQHIKRQLRALLHLNILVISFELFPVSVHQTVCGHSCILNELNHGGEMSYLSENLFTPREP